MAAKSSKKPKQGHLPSMEPPTIKVIDDAAETYFETMKERCRLSKEEDEAKDNLIDKMKENKLTRYETADGLLVTILDKSNVKCKKVKDPDNNDAD